MVLPQFLISQWQPGGERYAAVAEQRAEPLLFGLSAVSKIILNCLFKILLPTLRHLIDRQMNHERPLARKLFRRTNYVFLGVTIEVALVKGRWIERIEQPGQTAEVHLDLSLSHR